MPPIDVGEYRGVRVELERDVGKLPVVYRHLNDSQYARDFVEGGNFRLSTAGACKKAEGDARQDAKEGEDIRHVSRVSGFDPRAAQIIPKAAVNAVLPGMTFSDCTFTTVMDAFLLCLTDLDTPQIRKDFGGDSIKIARLDKFFWALVRRMSDEFDLKVATLARVRYGDRVLRDFEQAECPPMYRKPIRFADQNEIRISFQVGASHRPLQPFILNCHEIMKYCDLVDR